MKRKLWFALGTLLLLPSYSFALDANEVVEKVDRYIYTPERLGLREMTARVDVEQIKESLRRSAGFADLDFQVVCQWRPDTGSQFKIVGLTDVYEYLRPNIEHMLRRDEISPVPASILENLTSGYNVDLEKLAYGYQILGNTKFHNAEVQTYIFKIDERWRVVEMRSTGPDTIRRSSYVYTERDHYLLVGEESTYVKESRRQYYQVKSVDYTNIGGFWLADKISIRYTDDRGTNLGAPRDFAFKGHKVQAN